MGQQLIGEPGHSRAVVVKGLRTPFVKAGGVFGSLTALDLGVAVVRELVERADIDPAEIDQLVFGQVIPTLLAPSIAREVVLASALPRSLEAHTVARACATSLQALTDVASAMALGSEPGGDRRRHRVHVAMSPSSPAAHWPARW